MSCRYRRVSCENALFSDSFNIFRPGWLSPCFSCLFIEKGLDQPHLDLLHTDRRVTVVELDSFGAGLSAGPDLYVDLMQANYAAISGCVRSLKPGRADSDVASVGTDRVFPTKTSAAGCS